MAIDQTVDSDLFDLVSERFGAPHSPLLRHCVQHYKCMGWPFVFTKSLCDYGRVDVWEDGGGGVSWTQCN